MGGLSSEVAFLSRALKMPRIRQVAPDMAKTARAEGMGSPRVVGQGVDDH